MAASVQRIRLRLVVSGVELPVESVTVQGGQGQASVAAIALPPHDALSDLLPGSSIQVYYFDGRHRTHKVSEGSYVLDALPMDDLRRWKLLHDGVLRGYTRNKSRSGNWSFTLHTAAPSIFYNRVQQYFGGFKYGGSASVDMSFLGASRSNPDQRFNTKLAGASAPTEVYNVLKQGADLYGGNWIAGIRLLLKKIAFNNHPFWATEYKRLRVGDRLVGFDQDQSSHKLMPLEKFKKLVVDNLGQMGAQTAIRDVVAWLLEQIYHQWWETPCPHLSLGSVGFAGASKSVVSGDDPVYEGWTRAQLCASYLLPDLWWASPPACNVLFPDDYYELQAGRDFYNEATRVFLRTEVSLHGDGQQWARDAHYAPNLASMRTAFQNPNLPESFNARNATITLPWERFTGPIGNIHLVSQIPSKTGSALLAFLSHVANYDFWSLRCERSASLSGPFNPDLAVGLPALVVLETNPKMTAEQAPGGAEYIAQGSERRGLYPQALVGRLVGVTHSITQTSATTMLQMENARMHDEDFDLDGARGDDVEWLLNAHEDAQQEELRFFGEDYDATNIGQRVYKPLLGVGSVVDATGQPWTKEAIDHLVWSYGQRRLERTSSVRETNQMLTSRPVADLVQMVGDEEGKYPGYEVAGFLYASLETPGTSQVLRRIKASKQADVDKDQAFDSNQDTEPDDAAWTEIQELNRDRKAAALAVQKTFSERVFTG